MITSAGRLEAGWPTVVAPKRGDIHGGLLEDAAPMHVVHHDVVTPRTRSLAFEPFSCEFPASARAPQIYRAGRSRLRPAGR